MRYSTVLFDLDGTLVDSIPDLTHSINAMLLELGYTAVSEDTVRHWVGKGAEHLVAEALQHASSTPVGTPLFNQALQLFLQQYHRQNENTVSRLFPQVAEGLELFKQSGYRLAIVTNKPLQFVPSLLQHMGIAHYFELLVGGDTCAHKKPHPMPYLYACEQLGIQPHEALIIGDSSNDSLAARQAGIDVLLVPYGYDAQQRVHTLDCDGIVSTIVDAAHWANTPH